MADQIAPLLTGLGSACGVKTILGWVQCIFWCLLIKVNNFAFDEDAVLRPKTTCLDGT